MGFFLKLLVATILCVSVFSALPAVAQKGHGEIDYGIATNFYKNKNYQGALEHFRKSLEKGNNTADNWIYIGHCYAFLGKRGDAINVYKEVQRKFKGTAAERLATQSIARLQGSGVSGAVGAGSSAVAAASVTGSNDATLSMPAEEKIPYVRGPGGHLFVNGAVNGRPTRVLIDTGAFKVVIGKEELVALGIKPPTGASEFIGSGAAGALKGWEMELEVSIGRIKRKMPVQVFDGSQELLLGQPFLRGMHYQIDNSANYLHFTRDQKDLQKQMSYDSVEVPFQMQGGNLMVSAKVNGNPVELNFDTGAPHNVFTQTQMYMFNIEPYAKQMIGGVGGSAVVGYRARVDSMELGPIKKTNVECLISPAIGHGLVGQEFFGHMRYVIDNEKQVIRFAR